MTRSVVPYMPCFLIFFLLYKKGFGLEHNAMCISIVLNLHKLPTVMTPPCCQGRPVVVVWLQPMSSIVALCSHGVLLLLLQLHIC